MKFLLLIHLSLSAAGIVLLEESHVNDIVNNHEHDIDENVVNVKVNQVLPRHQCRRALRNIQVL